MLKKLSLIVFIFIGFNSFAQEFNFGIQGGYANTNIESTEQGAQVTENEAGFYIGLLTDFKISENWHLQASVNYIKVVDSDLLSVPVLLQYYIQNSGFYLQAGPQGTIVLEDHPATNQFGLDAAFGAGYHFTENFFFEARYGLELTNRYNEMSIDHARQHNLDINSRVNTLTIGVGYKF